MSGASSAGRRILLTWLFEIALGFELATIGSIGCAHALAAKRMGFRRMGGSTRRLFRGTPVPLSIADLSWDLNPRRSSRTTGIPAGAVVPPIYQTSLFTFRTYAEMQATFAGERAQPIYSRGDNPTVRCSRTRSRRSRAAEAARAFASGMAAISAAILGTSRTGERIVCVRHVYPDTYRLFRSCCRGSASRCEFVDGRDVDGRRAALPGRGCSTSRARPAWCSRSGPGARWPALARAHGAVTIGDNSWATPIFQRPLAHGVDLVVHSASKYLGGHSDTVAGRGRAAGAS